MERLFRPPKPHGAAILNMKQVQLDREDIDFLVERLRNAPYASEEDVEEARWLRAYIDKTGFVQLGFPFQGTMFICEISTEWYDRYQRLMDMAEDLGGITYETDDQDDEH